MAGKSEIIALNESYTSILSNLLKEVARLDQAASTFPSAFTKGEDYESFMLAAAKAKHAAIIVWRNALAAAQNIELDIISTEADLKLNDSETYLKDKGFHKITDSLRDSFVNNKKELMDLQKTRARIDAVAETTEKLVRAFEADETNFRRLVELASRMSGL